MSYRCGIIAAMPDDRARVLDLLAGIEPLDRMERDHRDAAVGWAASGAPLYRTRPPDVPPTHLVSYFVVVDEAGRLLLAAHRKAGLWLPPGGHVEPGEDPWHTVVRECAEELRLAAVPAGASAPLFVTVTATRGPGTHTDVSLWYLLAARAEQVGWYDEGEFAGIRWLSPGEVLAEPAEVLDPHMHRFTRKLARQPGSAGGHGGDAGQGGAHRGL